MAFSVAEGMSACPRMARATNTNGARGGNRTHTALRPPDFESGASASSATRASDAEGRLARGAASLNRRICARASLVLFWVRTKEPAGRRHNATVTNPFLGIRARGRTGVERVGFDYVP